MSIRDAALAAAVESQIVEVSGWEGTPKVLVKGLSAIERTKYLSGAQESRDYVYVDLMILTAHDPDTGELVFEPADRDHLANGPAGPPEQIAGVALSLSGLGADAVDDAEAQIAADPT